MCRNAVATAASLMSAIEPTIVSLLNIAGISTTTPPGSIVLTEYNNALTDIKNWQSGTTADDVLAVLADFQTAFSALPLPADLLTLESDIEAGIVAVIGIIKANSPAPAPATPVASSNALEAHDVQAFHAAAVAADTEAEVKVLVPSFKRSIFHSAASQYTKAWNETADASGHPEAKIAS